MRKDRRPTLAGRFFVSFPLLVVLLAGCDRRQVAIRDDLGRKVALARSIQRVITIAPNVTELVFAVRSGQKIVGTDDFSDFPVDAARLPKVGSMEPDLESIVRLRPDLVLASSSANRPGLAGALDAVGLPLYVVRTERLSQIAPAARRLATLLGGDPSVAASIDQAIAAQKRTRNDPPRVLFVLWPNPLYVAGHATFIDDLITLTGAVNAVPPSVKGWPQYSLEALVANPPDLVLFPSKSVNFAALEKQFKGFGPLQAVREGRMLAVDENRFTRPGPRVAEAASELNAILDGLEYR